MFLCPFSFKQCHLIDTEHIIWKSEIWNCYVSCGQLPVSTNLLYSSSAGIPFRKEHVNDNVFPPLTISTSKFGVLFISASGACSLISSKFSAFSSESTVWLMLKEMRIFSLSVCLVNSTSAPFSVTLKPSISVGMILPFCELCSAAISSLRNSTRSCSPMDNKNQFYISSCSKHPL